VRGGDEISGVGVVCALVEDPSFFKNNKRGTCHFCKREVVHRPNVPAPNTLICRVCWVERTEDRDELVISRETLRETQAILSRN